MAVAAGYSKVPTTGLVFAYDTADTFNCYSGPPTTNLYGTVDGGGSRPNRTAHYWDGYRWTEDATYTDPGVPGPVGTFLGKVYKHTSGALNATWSGNSYGYILKDINCAANTTYTMSSWVYVSTDSDISLIQCTTEAASSNNITVQYYSGIYDLNTKGWQRIARSASRTTEGNIRFIPWYPSKNGVTNGSFNGFFMIAAPQVEVGTFPTKHTPTSRSSTNSLKDLTGTHTIDLYNSYNSSGELYYNGTDDYATVTHNGSIDFAGGDFTASMWVKISADTGTYQSFIANSVGASTTRQIGLVIHSSRTPQLWAYSGAVWGSKVTGNQLNLNTWTHLVFHWVNGGNVKIYQNGVQTASASGVGSLGYSPTILRFGSRYGDAEWLNGQLDCVRMYDRVLSDTEIETLYRANKNRFGHP